jgi:hypothetical protein
LVTETWLNWNGDMDDPNDSKDYCEGEGESDIQSVNGMYDAETPQQLEVSATADNP